MPLKETKSTEEVTLLKPVETVKEKVEELSESIDKTEPVEAEENVAEKIAKMKADNDALEIETLRAEKLRAMGGRSIVQQEKTPEQESEEKAKNILEPFGY